MSEEIPTFDIGDMVRCSGQFTDANGVLIDPAVVRFKVKSPSNVVTSYLYGTNSQLVKLAVGKYYVDVSVAEAGTWFYRFYSTGTNQAAAETEFVVARSQF